MVVILMVALPNVSAPDLPDIQVSTINGETISAVLPRGISQNNNAQVGYPGLTAGGNSRDFLSVFRKKVVRNRCIYR
jgi:hypothetical protein